MVNSNFGWQPEVPQRQFKPLSPTVMRGLGIRKEDIKEVADLEELKEYPPNIVIAKAKKSLRFLQNNFKQQELVKKNSYVMGLGVYQQLHADPRYGAKFLIPAKIKFKNVYRAYRGHDLTDKTLLVFRTGGIGDLLFIQPNLIYLKEKYPSCTIKFACGPQYQSMVETWDCVDEVLDLPFKLKELNDADYHALFEGVIERCTLAHRENAYNLFSRWMGLDLSDELLIPTQSAKPDKVKYCYEKLDEWGVVPGNFILTQLRASSPIRTPRPEFWANIINSLAERGHNILITDNPRQADHVDEFIKKYIKDQFKNRVFNFCRFSLSLDYSIALASIAQCVIATDSAMNHIAASLDVPCYGVYGPFPAHIRLTTYPKAKWIDATRKCSPCFIHGHTPCPEAKQDGFSPCYDELDITKIVTEVEELIK